MYEDYFKLHGRPFLPAPQTGRYFAASIIEGARQTLTRAIERGEGAGLIVGPPGTGKTLLCQLLAQQFDSTLTVAQLTGGRLATQTALLQAILYELGMPCRGLDEGELRLTLLDFLEPSPAATAGLLLLVDEAHALPLRSLEEIRMLTNLVRDGQPRVRVVLAGNPVLEERFASPKLSSFAQRLAARCYLESLGAAETAAYVRAQISAVGGDPEQLLDDETLESVYRATDGIPRLINQVCDHALILASLGGEHRLSVEAIEEAWADLQQLPTPMNSSSGESESKGIVEFGTLGDASDDLPEAIPFRSFNTDPPRVARVEEPVQTNDRPADENTEIGPLSGFASTQVDIDFPEFAASGSEEFAEEEVVLDRYASDIEIFADVPHVSSWEGPQLTPIFDPIDASQKVPMTFKFGALDVREEQPSKDPAPISSFAGPDITCPPPGSPTFAGESRAAAASSAHREPVAEWEGALRSTHDREMIIVEDEIAHSAVQPARKREFRQLFAKLRRG